MSISSWFGFPSSGAQNAQQQLGNNARHQTLSNACTGNATLQSTGTFQNLWNNQLAMQQPSSPRTLIEQQMDENARVDAVVRPSLRTHTVYGGGGGSALSQQLGNIYPGQAVIMPVGSTIQSIAISGMGQGASGGGSMTPVGGNGGGGSAYIGYPIVPQPPHFPDDWLRMYNYERAREQVARMVEET